MGGEGDEGTGREGDERTGVAKGKEEDYNIKVSNEDIVEVLGGPKLERDKYENNKQSNDYKKYLENAKLRNSGRRVPSYDELYSIIDYLFSNTIGINSQTIKLDNGALSIQDS